MSDIAKQKQVVIQINDEQPFFPFLLSNFKKNRNVHIGTYTKINTWDWSVKIRLLLSIII